MSSEPQEETAEDLEQRVDRLERVVETQHEMMTDEQSGILGTDISRRDALHGGGLLGLGTLFGGIGASQAVGTAQASHGDGFVGTETDPVDVYGHDGQFQSLSTEELNNIGWAETTDGASEVQTAVNNYDTVFVHGPATEWTESVEVPSETTVWRLGTGEITIPSGHNLTTYDKIDPRDGSVIDQVQTVITNADHTNGDSDIEIRGFTVKYAGDVTLDAKYHAGIWLENATDSQLIKCRGQDIAPSAENNNQRAYGVLVSDSGNIDLTRCSGINCGYEGVGIRGNCVDIVAERCSGINNDTHSMQAGLWTGVAHDDDYPAPREITFRDCYGQKTITFHGKHGSENVRFVDCEADIGIKVMQNGRNCTIDSCRGRLILSLNSDGWDDINVKNHRFRDDADYVDYLKDALIIVPGGESNNLVNTLTVKDTTIDMSSMTSIDTFLWAGGEDNGPVEIGRLNLLNCDINATTDIVTDDASIVVNASGTDFNDFPTVTKHQSGDSVKWTGLSVEFDNVSEIPIPDAGNVKIEFDSIRGNSNGNTLRMQVSEDDGLSWLSADYEYRYQQLEAGASDQSGDSTADSEFQIMSNLQNDLQWEDTPLTISFARPQFNNRYPTVSWKGAASRVGGFVIGGGYVNNTADINKVQFYDEEGDLGAVRGRLVAHT